MTPAQVRAQIAAGDTAPVYLVESDDLPSRQEVAQAFLALVDEGLHAFNVATFFARDATTAADRDALYAAILSAARTLPMMAPRRLVVVHDADVLLTPKRVKDDDGAEVEPKRRSRAATPAEEFESYLQRPEPTTTLVLETAGLDRGRRITKVLLAQAAAVRCGELRSVEDVSRWIKARLDPDEMRIEPVAVQALVEAVGWFPTATPREPRRIDLARIRNEVDKLVLYAAGESTITAAHVRDVVIPDDDSSGIYALIDFLKDGNAAAAAREVEALMESGSPGPMILGLIRSAAGQLRPEARARRALSAVLDADLAIKSSRGEPRFVLERLVVELCGSVLERPALGR